MNNGRMWTVVKPSVGLPLLLGGVIIVSLVVHSALLANTAWFPAFWSGGAG